MELVAKFKDRLLEAINNKGVRQIDIAEQSGISKSLLNKYLKGISNPGANKLESLSISLGVSPVWLMGYDVPMRSTVRARIISKVEKLSGDELNDLERFIDTFILKDKIR